MKYATLAHCSTVLLSTGIKQFYKSLPFLRHRQLWPRLSMEQSREQSLKYVQGGLYFPELPQTHHGQHWNDMELDRTDGQVKLSILLTACSSKMCTEMEGLMMVAVSDTLTENWGVCWKLYFSSVKIPSGFWPSLNCCQRSVIHSSLLSTVSCIPVWVQTYLQSGEWQSLAHCCS